jgi:hypothetical protein
MASSLPSRDHAWFEIESPGGSDRPEDSLLAGGFRRGLCARRQNGGFVQLGEAEVEDLHPPLGRRMPRW